MFFLLGWGIPVMGMMVQWWRHKQFSDPKFCSSLFLWSCTSAHGRGARETWSMDLLSSRGAVFVSFLRLSESSPMLSSEQVCRPSSSSLRRFFCRGKVQEKFCTALPGSLLPFHPLLQPASWTPQGTWRRSLWVATHFPWVCGLQGIMFSYYSTFCLSNLFQLLAGFSLAVCTGSSSNNAS